MALIKLGALITEISGKIGGQSFGHGNGGTYLKNNGSQINTRTNKQLKQRNNTALISSTWRQLSTVQKDSFKREAINYPYTNRIGETKYYSGFNLFQKFNQNRILINESIILKCPGFDSLSNPTINIDSYGSSFFNVSATATSKKDKYLIFATPGISPGIDNPFKYFKLVKVATASDLVAPLDIYREYFSVFGQYQENNAVFVGIKAVKIDSGNDGGIVSTAKAII